MSFQKNVNLHVDNSAKLLNFSDDLLEHIKSIHSLIKVNVGVELEIFVRVDKDRGSPMSVVDVREACFVE